MNNGQSKHSRSFEIVRKALVRQTYERYGEHVRNIEVLQDIHRPYSIVSFLAVSTDNGNHRLVLKRMKTHPLNDGIIDVSEQSLVEYNVLSELYPKFAKIDRCWVPRPILVVPKINAYLMEFVEGHVLSDRLNFVHYAANRTKFRELQRHFYDCGRWLRYFQQFTGRRMADTSAVDNVLMRCYDRLQLIEEARNTRCPPYFRKIATDYVETQVDRLANTEIMVTGRHGDFGPWNTLASPGGVTVIDFFGHREDPLPVDIFGMLVFLDSQKYGLANSTSRIQSLQQKFLSGLGKTPELPEPLILLCEAQQRIQQVAARVIQNDNGVFSRWERSGSLRANIEWFMNPQEKSSLWRD